MSGFPSTEPAQLPWKVRLLFPNPSPEQKAEEAQRGQEVGLRSHSKSARRWVQIPVQTWALGALDLGFCCPRLLPSFQTGRQGRRPQRFCESGARTPDAPTRRPAPPCPLGEPIPLDTVCVGGGAGGEADVFLGGQGTELWPRMCFVCVSGGGKEDTAIVAPCMGMSVEISF